MNADDNNPGQGATGYPNEGWRFYRDAGKLGGIGRNCLPHFHKTWSCVCGAGIQPAKPAQRAFFTPSSAWKNYPTLDIPACPIYPPNFGIKV